MLIIKREKNKTPGIVNGMAYTQSLVEIYFQLKLTTFGVVEKTYFNW